MRGAASRWSHASWRSCCHSATTTFSKVVSLRIPRGNFTVFYRTWMTWPIWFVDLPTKHGDSPWLSWFTRGDSIHTYIHCGTVQSSGTLFVKLDQWPPCERLSQLRNRTDLGWIGSRQPEPTIPMNQFSDRLQPKGGIVQINTIVTRYLEGLGTFW